MRLQFTGIGAALAAALEVLSLAQMRLSLCSAIQGIGVAVLQLLSRLQRHHGTQLNSVKDAKNYKRYKKDKANLDSLITLAGMNAARRVGHTIVR